MVSPIKIWRRQKKIRQIFGKKGKIISWTKIFVTGLDFKKSAPYYLVLVKLEDKKRIIAQLIDNDEQDNLFDKEVKVVLRRIREISAEDVIPYGIKVKLIE